MIMVVALVLAIALTVLGFYLDRRDHARRAAKSAASADPEAT